MLENLRKWIAHRLNVDLGTATFQHPFPDYVVANVYDKENKHIGEHTDAHKLWGGLKQDSVIFSLALNAGGIFYCKPNGNSKEVTCHDLENMAQARYPGGKMNKLTLNNNLVCAVHQPPNTMIVMGGHFQSQLSHGTLPHEDVGIFAQRCGTCAGNLRATMCIMW